MKYVLGIESTAHTFGVAVVDWQGKILSNVSDSYITESGGMIPIEVRKHHYKVADGLFERALREAGIGENQINIIAFSNAPGLAPCLLEGMGFIKRIAKRLDVPIVCVNHCIAHLEIGDVVGAKDPVMLYASGANTQIIAYESGKYRVFGETLDLGVGNFIDTFARYVGLGFPGGPKIQKLAEECENKDELIELPYSIKGMDVAFSGLQTKLKNLLDKNSLSLEKKDSSEAKKLSYLRDLSYSMQEVVFAMLVEAAERALAHTGKKELLLGGGVACNSRLQEICKIMCEERGVKFFCPDRNLLLDNPAMIGYLGLKMFKKGLGKKDYDRIDVFPRQRTDEVEVTWK
ncbi:MAG: KEOPS complex N(6)-L-threonylcarbamoyladenine synthase Kae1 [Nanoarchaeota archaeon]|nr:KEOPS complex N(6)-L-threonylcarbamoyladenine synthase Kae1 [Nanoarchaeota archaeon]